MSEAESMELLANEWLARLVYNGPDGPTALPVVYTIDAGSIVLGTWDPVLFDEDLRTGIAQAEYQVAVEVGTRSMWKRVRDGSCWYVGRRIIWTLRPSARRSSMPGSSRGSRGCLRTSSG